jgi:hypothetical protein
MSEKAIRWINAMCLSIHSLCNPALIIKGSSHLVSNEPADTTDGEQQGLSSGSGRGLTTCLSD